MAKAISEVPEACIGCRGECRGCPEKLALDPELVHGHKPGDFLLPIVPEYPWLASDAYAIDKTSPEVIDLLQRYQV